MNENFPIDNIYCYNSNLMKALIIFMELYSYLFNISYFLLIMY